MGLRLVLEIFQLAGAGRFVQFNFGSFWSRGFLISLLSCKNGSEHLVIILVGDKQLLLYGVLVPLL